MSETATTPTQDIADLFVIGARVQARIDDDRLFYSATVTTAPIKGIMQVKFDDDKPGVLTSVPVEWAKIGEKREILRILAADQKTISDQPADDVIVSEGYLWIGRLNGLAHDKTTGPRLARLMSFGCSPKVYQSGVVLSDAGGFEWDHIFDPEQALALALSMTEPKITNADAPPTVVLVGGGGCTLPMAVREIFKAALKIEVVELHEAVMTAAHKCFGLPTTSPEIIPICGDGLLHLNNLSSESRSAILLDVCSTATEDGAPLEFPHRSFLEKEFLLNGVLRPLTQGGVFAMNVIGNAENLSNIATKLKGIFGNVHILATDPNFFFYCKKGPSSNDVITPEDIVDLAKASGLYELAVDVMQYGVLETSSNRETQSMVGWLGYDEFVRRIRLERK